MSTTEVNAALERVREASNLDALSVALDELSDATGDGEAVLPAKTKREVVSTLKTKARYRGFDWDQDAVAAYSRIYFKVDPFYVVELRTWLQFAPSWAALYLGTLFIQQRKPEWFTVAYLSPRASSCCRCTSSSASNTTSPGCGEGGGAKGARRQQ